MEVRYEVTEDDVRIARELAADQFKIYRRGSPRLTALFVPIGLCAATFAIASVRLFTDFGPEVAETYVFAFFATVIGFILLLVLIRVSTRESVRLMLSLTGPFPFDQLARIDDGNITFSGKFGSGSFPISSLLLVRELPSHIGIVLRPGSATTIPNSAFATDADRTDFLELLRPS